MEERRKKSQQEYYQRLPLRKNPKPGSLSVTGIGRRVRKKPELDALPRLSAHDFDTPIESGKALRRKESLANLLKHYYGKNLDREVLEAYKANEKLAEKREEARRLGTQSSLDLVVNPSKRYRSRLQSASDYPLGRRGGAPHTGKWDADYNSRLEKTEKGPQGERLVPSGRVLHPMSYSRIYEDFPVDVQNERGATYEPTTDVSEVAGAGKHAFQEAYFRLKQKDLSSDNPKRRENAEWFFKVNSLDPTKGPQSQLSIAQHELGHAAMHPIRLSGRLAYSSRKSEPDYLKSNEGKPIQWTEKDEDGYGTSLTHRRHLEKPFEVIQAAGRFQREFFKETGDRVKPGEFTSLVLSKEDPDYLSQEGSRFLNYARDTMQKIDRLYDDEEADAIQEHFLQRLETILPTVVEADQAPVGQRLA
jgi:hypothetical protein